MEKTQLVLFKNDVPMYICPWCKSYGTYDTDEMRFYGNCFYLVARCLKCKDNLEECRCNIVYPKCICKKHADTLQIKVSTKEGKYDVMTPENHLLMKKQQANIVRICKFICDTDCTKEVRFVTNPGNEWCKKTPVDSFIKDYISDIFKNVIPITTPIRFVLNAYQLPVEIIMFVFQLIVKLTNTDDLEGIVTLIL